LSPPQFTSQWDKDEITELLTTSEAIVLDLVNNSDQSHAIITQLKQLETEMDQLLIGISTVLTWAKTSSKVGKTPSYNETQYKRRKCSPRFRGVKQLESLVMACQKDNLFSYVVAPGVLYGQGESAFQLLFRDAWLCWQDKSAASSGAKTGSLPVLGEGNNVIPTIHVSDLAEAVLQIIYAPPAHTQYVVAVDGARTTQRQIVQAVARHLGLGHDAVRTVPKDDPRLVLALQEVNPAAAAGADDDKDADEPSSSSSAAAAAADPAGAAAAAAGPIAPIGPSDTATAGIGSGDPDVLLLDLAFQTQSCTLAQLPIQWRCLDGLAASFPAVQREFLAARKLRPVRVHVIGGPGSGKSLYAARVAAGMHLPHVTVAHALEEAAASKTLLGDAIRRFVAEAGATGTGAKFAAGKRGGTSAGSSSGAGGASFAPGAGSAAGSGVAGGARKPTVASALAGAGGAGKAGKPSALGKPGAALTAEDTFLGLRLPAKIVCEAVRRRLLSAECRNKGFVLDGFPRTSEEAKLLWQARPRVYAEPEDGDEGADGEEAVDADGNPIEREDTTWMAEDDASADEELEDELGGTGGSGNGEDGEEDDEETAEKMRMLEILQGEIAAEEEEAEFEAAAAAADVDESAPKPAKSSGAAKLRRMGGPIMRRSRKLDPATRVDFCLFLHVTEEEAARRLRELPESEVIDKHNDEEGFRRRWSRWMLQQGALGVASSLAARALNNVPAGGGGAAAGAATQPHQQGSVYDWVDVEVMELDQDTAADLARALGLVQNYLTKFGRPFNYFPSAEDLAAQRAQRDAAARAAAQRAQALRIAKARAEAAERARREAHNAQMRQAVLEQDRKLVEACSLPLRQYLVTHVVPAVVDGLLDVCKTQPEDPVDHLAEYLFKVAVNGSTFAIDDQN
jgi:adenylate kinase family enzyme